MHKNLKLLIFILIFFQILIGIQAHNTGECGVNNDYPILEKKDLSDKFLESQNLQQQRRKTAAQERESIRITYDFSSLEDLDESVKPQALFLKKQLELAQFFYADRLKVDRILSNNYYPYEYSCGNGGTDNLAYSQGIPDSDLHVYIIFINDSNSPYVATAGPCFSILGERPTFGRINYNLYYYQSQDFSDRNFQTQFGTTLHELMHILGFLSSQYPSFINPETGSAYGYDNNPAVDYIIRGIRTSVLTTPKVKQAAKEFYGCESSLGMQLENNGLGGSAFHHWDKSQLLDEFMQPEAINTKAYISKFTFALLEDSGWYDANYENIETPYWGRNGGCEFQADMPRDKYHYLVESVSDQGCSADYRYAGYGNKNLFLQEGGSEYSITFIPEYPQNTCDSEGYQPDYLIQQGFQFSENSRCFKSDINILGNDYSYTNHKCHQQFCDENDNIFVVFDGEAYACQLGVCTVTISGSNQRYQGTVYTPQDTKHFCGIKNPFCHNQCSSNGYCMSRECYCKQGFAGEDCSVQCSGLLVNGECQQITECPAGYQQIVKNRFCKPNQPSQNPKNCPENCSYCSEDGQNCTGCDQDFFLSKNSQQQQDEENYKCVTCSEIITNCQSCLSEEYCVKCQDGFSISEDKSSCIKCESGCANCAQQDLGFCLSCFQGQNRMLDQNGQCVCYDRFEVRKEGDEVCYPSREFCQERMEGCEECTGHVGTCTSCQDGFYLNQYGLCIKCNFPCETCLSKDECITCSEQSNRDPQTCECDENDKFYINQNNQCQEIPSQEGCKYPCNTCDTQTWSTCKTCLGQNRVENSYNCKCESGFFDNGAVCQKCSDSCKECEGFYNYCLECESGKVAIGGVCYQCNGYMVGCKECSSTQTCTECEEGFFLNYLNRCETCPENCAECVMGECKACIDGENRDGPELGCGCKTGYVQNSEKNCVQSNQAGDCPEGEFKDQNQICQTCQQGCTSCSSVYCYTCETGYVFVNYQCYSCKIYGGSACQECDNLYECSVCDDGYELNAQNVCVEIQDKVCGEGFYRDENNICQACLEDCKTCSSIHYCDSCKGDFRVPDRKCACSKFYVPDDNSDDCIYYLDQDNDNDNDQDSCQEGQYLDENNTCQQCLESCKTCSSIHYCDTCKGDFRDPDRKCACSKYYVPDDDSDDCVYYLDQDKCKEGQYLDEQNLCQPCKENCKTCSDQHTCDSCKGEFRDLSRYCLCSKFYVPVSYTEDCVYYKDVCSEGQFKDESGNCSNCLQDCKTCSNGESCDTCKGVNRDQNNKCQCVYGYIPVTGSNECKPKCKEFIQVSVDYEDLNLISIYLSFSDSNDLKEIGNQYSDGYSGAACDFAMYKEFKDLFGTSPKCKVKKNSDEEIQISIYTSYTTTYQADRDYLRLKIGENFSVNECDYTLSLTDISSYKGNFKNYSNDTPPIVPANGFTYNQGCQNYSFKILTILNDGKRALKNVSWEVYSSSELDNISNLQQINQAIENEGQGKLEMQIPLSVLHEGVTYSMKFYFQNFLGNQGTLSFEFKYSSSNKIDIQLINQNIKDGKLKEIFEDKKLSINLQANKCGNANDYINDISFSYEIQVTDKNGKQIYSENKILNVAFYQIQFLPKFEAYDTEYNFKISTKLDGETNELNFVYDVKQKDFIVKILGGSRTIQGNVQTLKLEAQVTQLAFGKILTLTEKDLQSVQWSGLDMKTNKRIKTINGEFLEYQENSLIQNIDLQKLDRENAYIFSVEVTNRNLEISTYVDIQLENEDDSSIDDEIQRVDISDFVYERTVSLYEDIQIQVIFKKQNADIENFSYKVQIEYNGKDSGIKRFYYPVFDFKIWDIISSDNFELFDNIPQMKIKVVVENLTNGYKHRTNFNINYLQYNQIACQVNPGEGTSISTIFQLQASNNNLLETLEYRFIYRSDKQSYKSYYLSPLSLNSSLKTILPYFQDQAIIGCEGWGDDYAIYTQSAVTVNKSGNPLDLIKALYQLSQSEELFTQINYRTILFLELKQNPDGELAQFVDFIKNLYHLFKDILEQQISGDLEESVMNVIGEIMEICADNSLVDLFGQTFQEEIESIISIIKRIVTEQGGQMMKVDNGQTLGSIYQFDDGKKNIGYAGKVQSQLGLINSVMNYKYQQNQQNSSSRRVLIDYDNNELEEILEQLAQQANSFSLPNDEFLYYSGDYYKVYAQRMSYGRLKNFLFTDAQSAFVNEMDTEKQLQINSSVDGDFIEGNNSPSNTYSVQYVEYFKNAFKSNSKFPYQDQDVSVFNLDIRLQNQDDNTTSKTDIILKSGYSISQKYQYKDQSLDKEKYVCIQQNKDSEEWTNKTCESSRFDDYIVCECTTLGYTSVVYDNLGLYQTINAENLQKSEFESLSQFNWIHVIIISIIVLQITFFVIGYFIDKKDNSNEILQSQDVLNTENNNIIAKNSQEQENQEQEQTQAVVQQQESLPPKIENKKKKSSSIKVPQSIIQIKKKMSSNKLNKGKLSFGTKLQILHFLLQILYVHDDKISRVLRFQLYFTKFLITLGLGIIIAKWAFYEVLISILVLCLVLSLYSRFMYALSSCFNSQKMCTTILSIINGTIQIGFIVLTILKNESLITEKSNQYAVAFTVGSLIDIFIIQTILAFIGYGIYKITKSEKIYSRPIRNIMMIQQKME